MRAARANAEVRDDELSTVPEPEVAAPSQAATAARRESPRAHLLKAWLPVPLLLLLLDVTFPLWFWHVPKLTAAGADYGYQFLVDAHDLVAQAPAPGGLRILSLGSSIAGSFDPVQVRALLRRAFPDIPLDVHRLLLPGIKPSDLRLFFATDGATVRPDVAVLLLNPLDFLNPSFERDLKPQVRNVLPPWATLRERSAFIPTIAGKLDLALASVSNLYRYRKVIRASLEDHGVLALHRLRERPATRAYGWYEDGYTDQEFGLPVDGLTTDLEYYINPEWLRQRGAVTLQFTTAHGMLARRTETEPGWKGLHLTLPADHGPLLYVSADSAWSPRAAGLDADTRLLGVRLRAVPAQVPESGAQAPLSYPPRARQGPDQLLRMQGAKGEEFVQRWRTLLEADTEFGRRFRAYRDAKVAARNEPVEPVGEYAELERLVGLLTARGGAVVLVNNPESPLMRALYEDSPHYRGYVAFLRGLAARYPRTRYADLRAQLPAEDFNDWHHVTYIGTIKMGPVFADLLRAPVADAQRQRHGGS